MPELPEVETVMNGLAASMAGRTILRVEQRRADLRLPLPPDFAGRLEGRRVEGFERRAKYILAYVEGGDCLLMHLGMSGRFSIEKPDGRVLRPGEFYDEVGTETAGAHDHVVFHLSDGTRITYADPRRFGIMDLFPLASAARHPLLKDLGIEPLGPDLTAEFLAEAFEGRKAPLKAALLDQSVVAGLGNIYVCEALFRARLSPKRKAGTLVRKGRPDARLDSLVKEIRAVLLEAITAGGSTLRDYARTDGRQGQFQERFAVYDREGEPCPRCASAVRRIVQSNRSTFFCPNCQR